MIASMQLARAVFNDGRAARSNPRECADAFTDAATRAHSQPRRVAAGSGSGGRKRRREAECA